MLYIWHWYIFYISLTFWCYHVWIWFSVYIYTFTQHLNYSGNWVVRVKTPAICVQNACPFFFFAQFVPYKHAALCNWQDNDKQVWVIMSPTFNSTRQWYPQVPCRLPIKLMQLNIPVRKSSQAQWKIVECCVDDSAWKYLLMASLRRANISFQH